MVKIYISEFTPCIFLFDYRQESSLDSPSPVLLSFNGHDKLKLFSFGIKRFLSLTRRSETGIPTCLRFDLKLFHLLNAGYVKLP